MKNLSKRFLIFILNLFQFLKFEFSKNCNSRSKFSFTLLNICTQPNMLYIHINLVRIAVMWLNTPNSHILHPNFM
jgi:hypothetical protein